MNIFKSRKFWAAIVGVIAVIAEAYGNGLDQEALIGLIMIVVSYITAIAINPDVAGDKIIDTFKSRRFWGALIGIFVILLKSFGIELPISQDNLVELSMLLSAFIVSTGLEQ